MKLTKTNIFSILGFAVAVILVKFAFSAFFDEKRKTYTREEVIKVVNDTPAKTMFESLLLYFPDDAEKFISELETILN